MPCTVHLTGVVFIYTLQAAMPAALALSLADWLSYTCFHAETTAVVPFSGLPRLFHCSLVIASDTIDSSRN